MSSRKRDNKPPSKAGKSKPRTAGSSSPATVPAPTPGVQKLQEFMQGMDQAAQSNNKNAFLYFTQSIVGKIVHVKSKGGFSFDAVFSVLAPREDGKLHFVFKGVKPTSGTPPANFENGAVLVVEADKIAQVSVASVNLQVRHRPDGLSTDSEIGKKDLSHLMNRELKAADSWLSSPAKASLDLEDARDAKAKAWDQFKANEQLFDVKTSFDENMYTTRLDKTKFTAAQEQEAARLAKAIESQRSSNIHLAEERNQATEHDFDEEDLYSGVARSSDPTKYRPPSQRKLESQKVAKKGEGQVNGAPTADSPALGSVNEDFEVESPKPVTPTPGATPTSPSEPEKPAPEEAAAKAAESLGEKTEDNIEKPATETKQAEKKKSTLNPSAKEFHFNPNARAVKPPAALPHGVPTPAYPPTMAGHMVPSYVPMPPVGMEPGGYPSYEVYDPSMVMPPMHMSMEEHYAAHYAYGYPPGGMSAPPMDANYMQMQPMYVPQPAPMHGSGYPLRAAPGPHHSHLASPYGSDDRRGGYAPRGRGRARTGSVGSYSDSGRR